MSHQSPTLARLTVTIACVAFVSTLMVSCNIVGPIAYIVEGPPRTPALFPLQDLKTAVFVDDRRSVLGRTELKTVIGDAALTTLMDKSVLTETIRTRDTLTVARAQDTSSNYVPMGEIGRLVGADQLIVVDMLTFRLFDQGYVPRPNAIVRIKLLDLVNETRVFPPPDSVDEWHVVEHKSREFGDQYNESSPAARRQLEALLAAELGIEVAKVFFEHETKELGEHLR
jgi:hypothetical protein